MLAGAAARSTSPATSRPTCRCSRWPTCSGVPAEDRGLLFDWSNRVIGWQDPDYAVSATSTRRRHATGGARRSHCARSPTQTAGCPTRAPAAGMPDLYAYAAAAGASASAPTRATTSCHPLAKRDDATAARAVSVEEFENLFWLFAVAGNETLRNGIPGGLIALLGHPETQRATARGAGAAYRLRWRRCCAGGRR